MKPARFNRRAFIRSAVASNAAAVHAAVANAAPAQNPAAPPLGARPAYPYLNLGQQVLADKFRERKYTTDSLGVSDASQFR